MADSGFAKSLHLRSSLPPSRPETPRTTSLKRYPTMSLPHETMVRPVHKHDFIETEASVKVDRLLEDEDAFAIILTGVPGNGKTFLAEEKSANLWHDNWSDQQSKIFRKFNCLSLETFCNDLTLFYLDLNISAPVLSRGRPPTWEIVQTMFEDVNDQFPFYNKLFIFDDVEDVEGLLMVLDHIARKIKENKEKRAALTVPSFRLFVTCQKKVTVRPSYKFIGETRFVDVKGFNWEETTELFKYLDVSDDSVQKLRTMLGSSPLALRICMKSLAADESGDDTEFVERYLSQIDTETKLLLEIPGCTNEENRDSSALIAIKIAIDRLAADLPKPYLCYQLLKILALLNAKDISRDLLVACAETITPDVAEAGDIVRRITSRLIERSMCTRRAENRVPLYSLHPLVKQSLQLFVKPEEKEDILKNALIGVCRILPKDGRKHQTRLIGFYADHCQTLDLEINGMAPMINRYETPFILLLHCNMLVGLGYCLLAQRNGLDSGLERLKQARNKYCELVLNTGQTYEELVKEEWSNSVERYLVHRVVASRLYSAGQTLPFIRSEVYRTYVRELPQYHRLTKKDLNNMLSISEEKELVNNHLSRQKLKLLKEKGRSHQIEAVIGVDKLAHVFIAELLAQIFCVWSKIHGKKEEYRPRSMECIQQSEAALEIYDKIYEEFGVYLLAALITEREMLAMKMEHVSTAAEVRRIREQIVELAGVGNVPDKRFAYEAGLMRSDLSQDQYHEMVCAEWKINCCGRLFQLEPSDREQHYQEGKNMLGEVERRALLQVYKESALSYCYKNYAKFLSDCQKYAETVVYIIKAMKQLHLSLLNGAKNGQSGLYPELENPRFSALYSNLDRYYKEYKRATRESRDDIKLLKIEDPEYPYLCSVVKAWRAVGGQNQPNDADTKYEVLENILESDTQDTPDPT